MLNSVWAYIYCGSLIVVFLCENVGTVISEILFFANPLKKFSYPAFICRIAIFSSHHANVLYGRIHINLTFHALSPRRSNTAFSHHYIAKNTWRNMILFPLCRKRREADLLLLEQGISTLVNEWHVVNFRNDVKLRRGLFRGLNTVAMGGAHESLILNNIFKWGEIRNPCAS